MMKQKTAYEIAPSDWSSDVCSSDLMSHLLGPSVLGEELYLYLAVTPHAVSSTLIREEDKVQRPVYNTSKALKGVEG